MRTLPTVTLAACAAAALALPAHAGGPSRGSGGGNALLGRPSIGVHPAAPAAITPSFRSPTLPRTRFFGPRPIGAVGVPVYVGPPAYFEAPGPAATPPVAYVAPPAAPAAPPPPEVVEYPDGRYELRGDGVAVPHRWVWIPNPPPAPPTAAAPKPDVRLYGWTDEHGVLHVTDRLDRIPERHRERAKRNASS